MYDYVTKSEIARYRNYCSDVLKDLKNKLIEKGIIVTITIVGSASHGLVMRNGAGSFDLDYNLEIKKAPKEYLKNLKRLKGIIRDRMDGLLNDNFRYGKDKTSCIRFVAYDENDDQIFNLDLGILYKDEEGRYYNLIHDKKMKNFIWNEIPNSIIHSKEILIKETKAFEKLKSIYKILKNKYINDKDSYPSFSVYVEAVNLANQKILSLKKKVSSKNHTKSQMDNYSNQNNPNNNSRKKAMDNRANQMNPNNKLYRGKR